MKCFKYFTFLLILMLGLLSCEDDFAPDYTDPQVAQTPVDGSADTPPIDLLWDRAAYAESVSQTGESALRDDRDQPTGDALQLVYDHLIEEATAEGFLTDMVAQYGLPAWGRSTIIRSHDSESYYISVPWIQSGTFTGVLQYLYNNDLHFAGFIPASSIDVDAVDDADPEALPIAFMAVMDLIYFGYRIDDVFHEDYFDWLKLYSVESGIESRSPTCSGYVNYTCSPCQYAVLDQCCYVTSYNLVCFSASGGPWNGGVSGGITTSGGSNGTDGGGTSSGDGTMTTTTIDPDGLAKSLARSLAIRQYQAEMDIDMELAEIEALIQDCVILMNGDGGSGSPSFVGQLDEDCVTNALLARLDQDLDLNFVERIHLKKDIPMMWDLTRFLGEHTEAEVVEPAALYAADVMVALSQADLVDLPYSQIGQQATGWDPISQYFLLHGLVDRMQLPNDTWIRIFKREWERATDPERKYGKTVSMYKAVTDGWDSLKETADALQEELSQLTDQFPSTTEEWQALLVVFGPMLYDLGVDISTDFIPIVGEIKGFRNAYLEFQEGHYWLSSLEFIGSVAGIFPIGDLTRASTEVAVASIKVFAAFKVIKALARVSGTVFRHIVDYAEAGWDIVWNDGVRKLFFNDPTGRLAGEINETGVPNIIRKIFSAIVDPSTFKSLNPKTLNNSTSGNSISRTFINGNGNKFNVTDPTLRTQFDDIVANADQYGKKTENLFKEVLEESGDYVHYDGSYNTINGFDGVFVKGDLSNPTEIIINESKQWTGGSVRLSGMTQTNPAQMTNDWVRKVARELRNTNDPVKSELADAIEDAIDNDILTKVVTVVDRTPSGNADGLIGGLNVIRVD